jgi:hypothetical protein
MYTHTASISYEKGMSLSPSSQPWDPLFSRMARGSIEVSLDSNQHQHFSGATRNIADAACIHPTFSEHRSFGQISFWLYNNQRDKV